jgi:membrane associated rhomboid family serine protease
MKRYPASTPRGQAYGAGSGLQIRLGGRFTPGVLVLLLLYAVTYVLLQLPGVGEFIGDQLMLRPALALGTRPYQLLTAPLLMTGLFALIFLGLLLWSVGSAVEQKLGTRRFLLWAGLCSLASALAAAAVGRLVPGQGLAVVALDGSAVFQLVLMAFAHFYGDMPVTMWGIGQPVSGRGLSYFFVGLGLCTDLFGQRWPHLAGATAAVLCALLLGRGGSGLLTYFRRLWRRSRRPSGMHVVRGGRAGSSTPSPRGTPQRWVN